MRLVALLLLTCSISAGAATYYVRTDGSDGNEGNIDNASGAWETIAKAASTVTAGDIVHISSGVYYEQVDLTTSGTSGNPIQWIGERAGTNWLSVIEPTENVSSGWVAAPEMGGDVWKYTSHTTFPDVVLVNNRRVAAIRSWTNRDRSVPWATVVEWMTADKDTFTVDRLGNTVKWWDAVQAAFWRTNHSTAQSASPLDPLYIRFRDGDDPNTHDIRISSHAGAVVFSAARSAFRLRASHNIISNLWIRGHYTGLVLDNGDNNTVVSNRFSNGSYGLYVSGTSSTNAITNNHFSLDRYGSTNELYGAYANGTELKHAYRALNYDRNKFGTDISVSNPRFFEGNVSPRSIRMAGSGSDNRITGNTLRDGINSIELFGAAQDSPQRGTVVADNDIQRYSSVAISDGYRSTSSQVYSNVVWDCQFPIRFHEFTHSASTLNRTNHYWGNLFGNPRNIGTLCYFGPKVLETPPTDATIFMYHNVFIGGFKGITAGNESRMQNVHIVNNIVNTERLFDEFTGSMLSDPDWIGTMDHNLFRAQNSTYLRSTAAWYGANNVSVAAYVFPDDDPLTSWTTPDAAVDIGTDINAFGWPGYTGTYWSGSAPDVGIEQLGASPDPVVVFVEASPSYAYETGPQTANFIFTRAGGTSGAITVNYSVGGTAIADAQYTTLSGAAVIADGQVSASVTVTPISETEGNRTVTATVESGTGYAIGSPITATITIVGNVVNIPRGPTPPGHAIAPRRL